MIAIVDYGLGNIRAFANVYKRLDIPFVVAHRVDTLETATRIILPGVGAFDQAMSLLQKSGLRDCLEELVLRRCLPVLGICVGMQMLAKSSEEGELPGLGWIDAVVKKFDVSDLVSYKTRLPHMGWNQVTPKSGHRLFDGLEDGSRFYFLHSYYVECRGVDDIAGETEYGKRFASAVSSRNIHGVQFHPEKSHHNGVQLLRNFASF